MSTSNRLDLETLGSQPIMSTNLPGHCFIHISCHLHSKVESLTRIPDISTVNLLYLLYDAYSKSSTSPQTHESGGEDYGIKVVAVTPVAVKFLMLVVLLLLLLLLSGLHPPPTHLTVMLARWKQAHEFETELIGGKNGTNFSRSWPLCTMRVR